MNAGGFLSSIVASVRYDLQYPFRYITVPTVFSRLLSNNKIKHKVQRLEVERANRL